jgi:hypothetical protein
MLTLCVCFLLNFTRCDLWHTLKADDTHQALGDWARGARRGEVLPAAEVKLKDDTDLSNKKKPTCQGRASQGAWGLRPKYIVYWNSLN